MAEDEIRAVAAAGGQSVTVTIPASIMARATSGNDLMRAATAEAAKAVPEGKRLAARGVVTETSHDTGDVTVTFDTEGSN